ncbi:DinB family protein [Zhihengliuella halotolerans]|uniref:DinB family protein n=1 Tax=Zhihengliuella halotolerans TaxID=370736 RepID=A0A4Q8AH75_9MICC|nr:DinB family protein [Zhihengliuella halotolerans]RZU63664.1 DinB family protein [Zhihengliuella halotolerans]
MTTQRAPEATSLAGWNARILDQLDFHWRTALRPRMEGMTDHEYRWEPVPDCWNVRPRGEAGPAVEGAVAAGGGDYTIDFAFPEPTPPPVTTIAWRLGHLIVGVFGARNASHFGGAEIDYETHVYAGTAAGALDQLDAVYEQWIAGVRGLGEDGLARPCGPAEGPYGESPLADLVLHINREAIHHGAEIALLRDLYAHRTN